MILTAFFLSFSSWLNGLVKEIISTQFSVSLAMTPYSSLAKFKMLIRQANYFKVLRTTYENLLRLREENYNDPQSRASR